MIETTALFDFIQNDLDKMRTQTASAHKYGEFIQATRESRAAICTALRRSDLVSEV